MRNLFGSGFSLKYITYARPIPRIATTRLTPAIPQSKCAMKSYGSPFQVTNLPKGMNPATQEIAARITSGRLIVQG